MRRRYATHREIPYLPGACSSITVTLPLVVMAMSAPVGSGTKPDCSISDVFADLIGYRVLSRMGQQVERSIDSDSEDEQDMEMEENYETSESDDSIDGELGQLCRTAGTEDVGTDSASDAEGDMCGLRTISLEETKVSQNDDMQGLDAIC